MNILSETQMAKITAEVNGATQPATALERLFAGEMAHAAAELERVRANKSNLPAAARLESAYSRATRSWNRARKELASLQTARTNHLTRLSEPHRPLAHLFPLADPARVGQPRPASGSVHKQALELFSAQTRAMAEELHADWERSR